jgi:hypothetical protein
VAGMGQAEDVWRRAIDANLRFYGALGRLTADYFGDLFSVLGGVASPQAAKATATASEPAKPQKRTAVMVLEEVAGKTAVGVFLVENHLTHEVAERPVSSVFVDSAGRKVSPVIRFDPEVVTLAPGEQLLVRVMAAIDDTLEPEVRYQGELTIPELTSTAIPIVLRRRTVADGPPGPATSSRPAGVGRKKNASSRRARSKRGSAHGADGKGQ